MVEAGDRRQSRRGVLRTVWILVGIVLAIYLGVVIKSMILA